MTRGCFAKAPRRLSPYLRLCLFSFIFTGVILSSICALTAQTSGESRPLKAEFYTEDGCPVRLETVRAVLDLDPFDAPLSSKIYITYKNISNLSLSAVKFRLRFTDPEKHDRGTFHAPDSFAVAPGETRAQKWQKENGLHPGITTCHVRVLQVRFSDGSNWESARLKSARAPQGQDETESGTQNDSSAGEGPPSEIQDGGDTSGG